jgi:ribonuclease T2
MRSARRALLAGLALALAGLQGAGTAQADAAFDFYVLTLSWSPSYCEAEGEDANHQQCASGRPYAFVVHGLWPQYEHGYPSDCRTYEREVDRATADSLADIMPSAGLVRHQWRKHGSCTGLSQSDYFRVLRQAREAVAIPSDFRRLTAYRSVSPAEVERAFMAANPGIEPQGIAATCDRRLLREVRICMTRTLDFRACPQLDRQSCRRARVVMPPVRGG